MPDHLNPPRPKGSTDHEIRVIAEAHRVACLVPDRRHVQPIRDLVELVAELIEDRGKVRRFGEQWESGIDGDC